MTEKARNDGHILELRSDYNPKAKLDILFFHGLGGDKISTWTNEDEEFWPEYFLMDEERQVNVWIADYPTQKTRFIASDSSMLIEEHAKNFIETCVSKDIGNIPLLFVCHSLGSGPINFVASPAIL